MLPGKLAPPALARRRLVPGLLDGGARGRLLGRKMFDDILDEDSNLVRVIHGEFW